MGNLLPSYSSALAFRPERFNPVPIGEGQGSRALVVCLEPGQFIPVHAPGVDITFAILEGKGTLVAGDREAEVGPGAVAFARAGERRGLLAKTRLVALHVVAPAPTEADHAGVMAGLRRGTWK